MKNKAYCHTPLGMFEITEQDGCITALNLAQNLDSTVDSQESPLLKEAAKQLTDYLAGVRKTFDLPLAETGTSFQKEVWQALRAIPYGETRSYGQIAQMIGNPKASRAVGMANHKNPLLILTPCHRVVGAKGQLTGFAAGLDVKKQLLMLEQTHSNPESTC